MVYICEYCNKEFTPKRLNKNGKHKYCSMKCKCKAFKNTCDITKYKCIKCGVQLTKENTYDSAIEKANFKCIICWSEYQKEFRLKALRPLMNEWNNECCVCGKENNANYIKTKRTKDKMAFHEINYIPHKSGHPNFYKTNFDRFIFICEECHQVIHWFNHKYGLNIEEVWGIIVRD